MDQVTSFSGEYFFLSNFYPHPVRIDCEVYPTNEHAFHALKTDDPAERARVCACATPAAAKHAGRRVTLRPDWNTKRFEVMERIVRIKFANARLKELLTNTGEAELIEGNTWRDTTWGCVQRDGGWRGRNELGKILMRVRDDIGHPKSRLNANEQHVDTIVWLMREKERQEAMLLCGVQVHQLIDDFVATAKIAGHQVGHWEIAYEHRAAPHKKPRLPNGKMAVYVFVHGDHCLKVGKVGPKSGARFTSQHYKPSLAKSTLAGSLIGSLENAQGLPWAGLSNEDVGAWLLTNTERHHFYLDADKPLCLVALLEAFLQCRLTPRFEG